MDIGIKGKACEIVKEGNTALSMGSGGLKVYATPAMIALAEKAAYLSVEEYLEEGQGTVGTLMDIKHMAATPVGMEVRAESELIEVNNRELTFKIEVFDEREKIGEGIHKRFIIYNEKFQNKVNAK
ncbi:MAG: thioesterase family protein [Clostridia bacterium]|nr:thioesterase family protein [Clostridia bacterium]